MPKQINSFTLPDNIIKEMKNKIKETKKSKVEVGFALCRDEKSHVITKGTECTGTKCSVQLGRCPDHIYIGSYHTHPRTHPIMSITDMVTGCSEEITCIGSVPFGTIKCFARKTHSTDCLNDTSPFEQDEKKISETGEELASIMRSPKSIVKTGVPKLLKGIYQHEKDVSTYHINRARLLGKHFNQINIK
jgi:hypothetical protein